MTSIHLPGLAQLLFLFTFLNVIHSTTSERCSTDSNFTANSTFHSNLNLLLPSLISAAVPSGYANKSTGRSPDQVFGVALCRGDLFPDECQACLATVVDKLRSRCPYGKDAAFWLDCFLAYSNTNFSADSAKSSFVYILYNVGEVSEPQRYKELVGALMLSLIDWAAYKTGRLFAMAQANFTSSTRVYGLVQCTRDQSGDDCSRCLRASLSSMQSCCWRNQGGVVLKYRCYMRYETYEYYNMSLATAPLPPLPAALSPPPPTTTTSPPPPPAAEDSDSSPSIGTDAGKKQNSVIVVLLVVPVLCALVLVSVLSICFWRRGTFIWQSRQSNVGEEENQNTKALFFDLDTLKVATNNFSEANKLGEGGFGPVYKGVLSDGQEIAVKRLSSRSQQGFAELRNEVALVAKLQHRNLVRLIGCCLEEEKLLVYEFLPNTSLDKILFDSRKCEELNWERRYKIIEGIARGLLYLHEDSPQKVVHRDLKPGNILLDKYMKPKISDFGLSKLFDNDKSEVNASRIVGTNGYIAPEYACHRHFSTKSDVYSYGVLVLEIITGRRISAFRGSGNQANLQSYAWKYWSKGKALRIVDQRLGERYHQDDVLRCIHMALLCVQDDPSKRPSMASVILMLSSASMTNPSPSAPGFLVEGSSRTSDSNGSTRNDDPNAPENKNRGKCTSSSVNDVSITMEPR